tara:strand:+ start:62386 stop:62664 length:279 start_codon:yes stop_codon:yes gene_type:complete
MELDLTNIVRVGAVIIGLVTAYGAKADGFRAFMSKWFTSKPTQARSAEENKDRAWRELINDSRERKCSESVRLLNEWIQIRTCDGLSEKGGT